MVSYGNLLVQLLVTLVGIPWTSSAEVCGSSTLDLLASRSSSYLSFPNSLSKYPPSTTCTWTIRALWGQVVELKFIKFDTEGTINWRNSGCLSFKDLLYIYDGSQELDNNLLGRYCGNSLPPNVYSSGTTLFLRFKSDRFAEKEGFHLKYTSMVPKPDPTICSPFNTFSQNNAIEHTGSYGHIESPLYGSKYPSNMQCTWVITVPKGKIVKLTFSEFSVGELYYTIYTGCTKYHDNLEIKDGKSSSSLLIEDLCSSTKPSPVYSTGRHMWIRFQSNSDNYLDDNHNWNGFKATYEAEVGNMTGAIIGVVVALIIVIVLVLSCIYIRKRRSRGHVSQPRQTLPHTTLTYNNQNPTSATPQYPQQMAMGSGGASYPHVIYSPAPQGSCPPPSSGYPSPQQGGYQPPPPGSSPSTGGSGAAATGYPPQSSIQMKNHPSQSLLGDPPPNYAEVVPDASPPYPATSQNPSQVPLVQQPPAL